MPSSSECPTCGTNSKDGRRSCCARGGAWFKKCGNAGDVKFAHTWAQGMKACTGVVSSVPVKGPLQVVLRQMGNIIDHPSNTTQSRNGARQQGDIVYPLGTARPQNVTPQQTDTSTYRDGFVSSAGTMDSKDCVGVSKIAIWICVLLNISRLQMHFHFAYTCTG